MKIVHIRKPRPGEKLPKAVKAVTLRQMLAGPDTRVVTDASIAATQQAAASVRKKNLSEFRRVFAAQPEFVKRLAPAANPGNPSAPAISVHPAGGTTATYLCLNADAQIRDALLVSKYLADSRRCGLHYQALHERAAARIALVAPLLRKRVSQAFGGLATPQVIASHSRDEILAATRALGDFIASWLVISPTTRPAGFPPDCGKEEGTGDGSDMNGCSTPAAGGMSSKGLFTACNWPLKWTNTCVRNQANRGACPAFSTVAAVESAIAFKDSRWVNLSEQHLYKFQKLDCSPPPYFGDGYAPPISLMFQLLTGYVFPYEYDWKYNPSCRREPPNPFVSGVAATEENDPDQKYEHSCDGYTGICSDTTHQAGEILVSIPKAELQQVTTTVCNWMETIPIIGGFLGEWLCQPVTNWIEVNVPTFVVAGYEANVPPSSGYRVTSFLPIWEPLNGLLGDAQAHLSLGHPVVFCFTVPDSFRSVPTAGDAAGYVSFSAGEATPSGSPGHCVLITGFILNANLPRGFVPGAGGGYFIVKNSWGVGFGDRGYCYCPFDWVKKWGTAMAAVIDVAH